jgi:hypothetical protein
MHFRDLLQPKHRLLRIACLLYLHSLTSSSVSRRVQRCGCSVHQVLSKGDSLLLMSRDGVYCPHSPIL